MALFSFSIFTVLILISDWAFASFEIFFLGKQFEGSA